MSDATILGTSTTTTGDGTAGTITDTAKGDAGATGAGASATTGVKPAQQTTTEGQPKPGDATRTQGKPAEPAAADVELKFPEGLKTDAALVDGFKAVAKELGLKSEGAQKVADLFVKSQKAAEEKWQQEWTQQQTKWKQDIESDKEIGGANLKPSLAAAQQAIARFGSPELAKLLDDPNVGNHPALVRFAVKVGKALAEDSAGTRSATPKGPKDSDEAFHRSMYPNSPELFRKE